MLNVAIVEAVEHLSMHDEAADLSTLVSSLKVLLKQQREFAGELN